MSDGLNDMKRDKTLTGLGKSPVHPLVMADKCDVFQDTSNWGNPWHSKCGAHWTGGPDVRVRETPWPFCPGCGKPTHKTGNPHSKRPEAEV